MAKKFRISEEGKKQIKSAGCNLAGCAAGLCTGLVIKSALEMIVPMPMKPVAAYGFKVGKVILAGLSTTVVERAVALEFEETADKVAELKNQISKRKKLLEEPEEDES